MRKFTFVFLTSLLASSAMYAQFRMDKSYTTPGIRVSVDSANATKSVVVDFNTDKALSSYGSIQKATTQRGVQLKVYNELGVEVSPKDSKCNNYASTGNPIHVSNVDSIISFYTAKNVPAWSTSHNFWLPANGIFDMDSTTNQAIGVYPGIYKEVDCRFYFSFEGYTVNSDIEFDVQTYNAGNTGSTAVYKLMVSLGTDKTSRASESYTPDYTVTDFYTTGSGIKHVKLAELLGVDPSVFSNKKVYISLYTTGTGVAINPFKYDPVITVDNFSTTLGLASWITPAVGIKADTGQTENSYGNEDSPITNISYANDTATFPFDLEMKNRIEAMTVTIDSEVDPSTLPFRLVGAQSWDGSEWVTISGTTITEATQDSNGDWGSEKISIPVGDGGDEKIRLLLARKVTSTDAEGNIYNTRLELDNGTRFWYQYYGTLSLSTSGVINSESSKIAFDVVNGKIVVKNATSSVNIVTLTGQTVASVSSSVASEGVAVSSGTYIVTTGKDTVKLIVD